MKSEPAPGYEATYCVEIDNIDQKHGPEILIDPQKTVVHQGTYSHGTRHGYWQYFGPQASVVAQGRLENDLRAGKWEFFNQEGDEIAIIWYADGRAVGCGLVVRGINGVSVLQPLPSIADCASLEERFRSIVLR